MKRYLLAALVSSMIGSFIASNETRAQRAFSDYIERAKTPSGGVNSPMSCVMHDHKLEGEDKKQFGSMMFQHLRDALGTEPLNTRFREGAKPVKIDTIVSLGMAAYLDPAYMPQLYDIHDKIMNVAWPDARLYMASALGLALTGQPRSTEDPETGQPLHIPRSLENGEKEEVIDRISRLLEGIDHQRDRERIAANTKGMINLIKETYPSTK